MSAGAVAATGAAIVLSDAGEGRPPIVATADRQAYEVASFEEISTLGPQDLVITLGEAHSVRGEGSPEALARFEVVVEDGTLAIRPKSGFGAGINRGRLASATFYVTTPRLEQVALAGSGDVRVDRIEGERFSGTIAGPGELGIGSLQVGEADFSIAGSGNVVAAGSARETRVSIVGSGDVRASGLRSETASISIGGSGDADLTVDRQTRVSIIGSGDVDITGDAQCSVSRMGSGTVTCGGGEVED